MDSAAASIEVIEPPGSLEMRALAAFAALGQPTRLSMLRLLSGHEPCGMTVREIALAMQCPQNTASGHLAILSRAQLVIGTRSGRAVIYRVDLGGVRWLVEYLLADCCNGDPSACADIFAGICATDCSDPSSRKPCR
jgi:ArsR family transcriptional regulator, arsenate/arsenite/antimonite-responsive transcriptional repressor